MLASTWRKISECTAGFALIAQRIAFIVINLGHGFRLFAESVLGPAKGQNRRKFPIRFCRAAICCFPESELRNLNYLVLIPSCLGRAIRAGRFAKGRSGNRRGGFG